MTHSTPESTLALVRHLTDGPSILRDIRVVTRAGEELYARTASFDLHTGMLCLKLADRSRRQLMAADVETIHERRLRWPSVTGLATSILLLGAALGVAQVSDSDTLTPRDGDAAQSGARLESGPSSPRSPNDNAQQLGISGDFDDNADFVRDLGVD